MTPRVASARRLPWRRAVAVVLALALAVTGVACRAGGSSASPDDRDLARLLAGTGDAPWDVRVGVEQITVSGARPGQPLTLHGARGGRLVTLLADGRGQAHFAYLPPEHTTVRSGPGMDLGALDPVHGTTVAPGHYAVVDDSAEPRLATGVLAVPGRDDHPDQRLYERQDLAGARLDLLGAPAPGTAIDDGFQYLEMRDGVLLSANVRFPDEEIYGPAPWPTVIEYSGYGPSNPATEEPGSRIARTLGYATVSVNARGTGCSGGVFDMFNPAQMADGYDIVEIVATQDWALGGRVGMVGLSYSGITQLYTAATAPPHLAAITAQSVIADPWLQAWPGGIFNAGFTQQWAKERDAAAAPGGASWVTRRIGDGDTTCAGHQALRDQNPDFENLVRSLTSSTRSTAARDLRRLVGDITAPVFISGAFQDEQTGPQFTQMLDRFDDAAVLRVNLWNGRHPDGDAPVNLNDVFEFLELYVADRVPEMDPLVRAVLPGAVAGEFGLASAAVEPDRFGDLGGDVDAAREAYESEPPVRVAFESGSPAVPDATGADELGEPGGTFVVELDAWPSDEAVAEAFHLGPDETLTPEEPGGADAGAADAFRFDPEAGESTLFGGTGDYPLLAPTWDMDWTRFGPGEELSYLTAPFTEDTVFAGPAYADLFVASDARQGQDVNVQVSLSEVRPDGTEYLVTNGWLDLADRAEDRRRTDGLEIVHPFTEDERRPLEPGEFVEARVDVPSFAHAFRAGSRLRLTIATPGRNHATWEFANGDAGGAVPATTVARSPDMPSSLVLSRLPGVEVPAAAPAPCPGLRGMACRPFVATENLPG